MEATKIEGTRSTSHVLRSTTERSGPSLSVILQQPANAPVQARWANAQRAGPAPPNPPTVACNRLLAGTRPELAWEIFNESAITHRYYQELSPSHFKDFT